MWNFWVFFETSKHPHKNPKRFWRDQLPPMNRCDAFNHFKETFIKEDLVEMREAGNVSIEFEFTPNMQYNKILFYKRL